MRGFIPLADARSMRPWARVTAVVAGALAVAAIACAVLFGLLSRNAHTRTFLGLPPRTNGVLVLDISASISSDTFSRIGGTLQKLSRSGGRYGLVVFSGSAYEALPPGTPASDLAPLVRYFKLPPQKGGYMATFPTNPWSTTFSGGTKISTGMQLATEIAAAQPKPATIILVSDLDDAPSDLPTLGQVLYSDRTRHIPVQLVGLSPTPTDLDFFAKILGPQTPVTEAPTLQQAVPHNTTPFPWPLVLLVSGVAAFVAAGLAWAPRLDWRTS